MSNVIDQSPDISRPLVSLAQDAKTAKKEENLILTPCFGSTLRALRLCVRKVFSALAQVPGCLTLAHVKTGSTFNGEDQGPTSNEKRPFNVFFSALCVKALGFKSLNAKDAKKARWEAGKSDVQRLPRRLVTPKL